MQLAQLRYLLATAETGSFRAAAAKLYVSQSSVSVAVRDLERECGVTVFERTARGVTLTAEGAELANYARNVVVQADIMEQRYAKAQRAGRGRFAVSSQHYSLVVDAFADLVASHVGEGCDLALRESHTDEIIRDVRERRSEVGVVYLSNYNERVMRRALDEAGLKFSSLYKAIPHAIVGAGHPLAGRERIALGDLAPFRRIEQEQGMEASSFFAEEPIAAAPSARCIAVSDNGTMATLLARSDAYALGTGAFRAEGDVAAVPIETDEVMDVGYIMPHDAQPSVLARTFLELLARRIAGFDGPIEVTSLVCELAAGKVYDDAR